jgi:hypothetical protein
MAAQTESEAIQKLGKLLEDASSKTTLAATGACVYTAGSKTYCAVMSEAYCSTLNGVWTSGGKCP